LSLVLQTALRQQFGGRGIAAWIAALAFAGIGTILIGWTLTRKRTEQGNAE